jgi:hypothetical protein
VFLQETPMLHRETHRRPATVDTPAIDLDPKGDVMHLPHRAVPGPSLILETALALALALAAPARAAPAPACGSRALGSVDELVQCIRRPALMDDLRTLQQISDQNPGSDGHGNRDTGTAGYKASVDFVVGRMRRAGYAVTIQSYPYTAFHLQDGARLESNGRRYALGEDWHVARLSGSGKVEAPVQAVGAATQRGCVPADFAGFVPGRIALVERAGCALDDQVANAEAAGAAALIVYDDDAPGPARPHVKGQGAPGAAFAARLQRAAAIPVVGVASRAVGLDLQAPGPDGQPVRAALEIHAQRATGTDYNVIADSPFGDPNSLVVVEGHLDAIFGAGILDNGTGSASILEIGLAMAGTPTRHRLRYIWFGGEELGLLGSAWYTRHLSKDELAKLAFDIDADVTGTPNYAVLVADPGHAHNADRFPPNVVPESKRGNKYFADYFASIGMPSKLASFGNDGTDSNSFSLVGIPNTGVLTEQDCCKSKAQVTLWGGYTGNYEGKVPGRNGGCVDRPGRWCDNIDNVDPDLLALVSRAVAYVTWRLANDDGIGASP